MANLSQDETLVTCQEIMDRIYQRTDDLPAITASNPEVLNAVNEGQELASWLSLCLETSTTFTFPASVSFGTFLPALPDYLCPLRVTISGARLRPATLADMDAENDAWQATVGIPTRYAALGFDLWALNRILTTPTGADFIYARSPVTMTSTMTPEIPEEYHQSLVRFGKYRVRVKEGAQALNRGIEDLNRFLDDIGKLAAHVRARSLAAKFDTLPFEMQVFDRSRLSRQQAAPVKVAS